jgi:hypothetical protein
MVFSRPRGIGELCSFDFFIFLPSVLVTSGVLVDRGRVAGLDISWGTTNPGGS